MQKNENKKNNPVEPEGDGAEIAKMLIEDVSCAKKLSKEDWDKLNGRDWANLLCRHSEFDVKCPWDKLEGSDWVRLLLEYSYPYPFITDHCQWNKLDERDWAMLLDKEPRQRDKHRAACVRVLPQSENSACVHRRFRAGTETARGCGSGLAEDFNRRTMKVWK